MEHTNNRLAELSADLLEQWLKIGGSAYHLRTATPMDILDSAYKNGLELKLVPVDKTSNVSYNLDIQEGITMSNVPQIVFNRIVADLKVSEPAPTFEIVTEHVTYKESHTMVAGQRVNLGQQLMSSCTVHIDETDNLSKWIYSNLGA